MKRLARQISLPNYESLPKPILYQRLKEQFNFERLLRADQRSSSKGTSSTESEDSTIGKKRSSEEVSSSSSSTSSSQGNPKKETKKIKLNTLDPIMLVTIGKKKTFKFTRPNGTQVQFLVDSLVDYLIASGEFSDPETRIPFSDADLAEIDKLVSKNNKLKLYFTINKIF